ncbi:MAG: diguanylate cyclase [Pseudomonadota bacterium]
MKVGDSKPTAPARPAARVGATAGVKAYQSAGGAAAVRDIADTASVMGLSEAEMTPKVREAIMTLMAEVDRLRQELETTSKRIVELEQLADRDPLLPLYNRRAFVRELTRVMALVERYNETASLIYIDLNDFKDVNDTHGHAAGDAVLEHIGELLVKNVRGSDAVGRLGGDEFGVILAHTGDDAAEAKARQLAAVIDESVLDWRGQTVSVGAAVGALTLHKGQTVADALDAADRAMYEQKRARKENPSV